jgi:CRISPR-associated endonuclease Csn1
MFRFSFDLGTNSIGWAVYELDAQTGKPTELGRLGVRIFSDGRDPQNKESNAKGRREPRSHRRQQDRRLKRSARLLADLETNGLMPPAGRERDALFPTKIGRKKRDRKIQVDPYELRALAARQPVTLHQLGRAIWHISKHRGFQSNRRADKDPDESGKIATGSRDLQAMLDDQGHPTYGAFLWSRLENGEGARIRLQGAGAKSSYDFYPTRAVLQAEFDKIWQMQEQHHPELTEGLRQRIRDTVFHQRPLKPVVPGRCAFFPDKPRLAKWHPLAQEFLILSELANLRIVDEAGERALDLTSRNLIAKTLLDGQSITWAGLRRTLNLGSGADFNLEEGGLKKLAHNEISAQMIGSNKKPGPLAEQWRDFDDDRKVAILEKIDKIDDPDELIDALRGDFGFSPETATALEKVRLPDGHLRFCEKATHAIVVEMRQDNITYDEAVNRAPDLGGAGLNHSDFRPDAGVDILPPYNRLEVLQRIIGNGTGNPDDPDERRYGKITNPTVHIALGQFRRVMNMLIQRYGKPAEVVLETARDLRKSTEELKNINSEINKNEARNDRWRQELEEAGLLLPGQRVGDHFLRMRLWEEMGRTATDRCCPYTGKPICLSVLHSDAVEIEHILPQADTFDNSPANKTVAFREANRRKGNLSPAAAALRYPEYFDQEAMIAHTRHLPNNKNWRFRPDAMEKWEAQKSFDDRQLHATGYIAKVTRTYAEALFPKRDADGERRNHVWVLTGKMTALLRQRWALNLGDHNRKDRNDHRHHAIDAAVIGVIDRTMIKRLHDLARRHGEEAVTRFLPAPPEPFDGFRDAVHTAIRDVRVSHRAQHGSANPADPSQTSGRLHADSAYGQIRDVPENQADLTIGNVVIRKPVVSLSAKEIGQVRDFKLRDELQKYTGPAFDKSLSKKEQENKLIELLTKWSDDKGHRNLRLIKPLALARPVSDKSGKPYKWNAPGENHCVDIVERTDGKWAFHAIDIWQANSGGGKNWCDIYPDAKFVMRLHKNDTVQLFDWDAKEKAVIAGSNQIKLVKGIWASPTNKYISLVGINETGQLDDRAKDPDDYFEVDKPPYDRLRLRRARRVRIDELGRVHSIPHGKLQTR